MNILAALWAFLSLVISKLGPKMKPIIKTGEEIYNDLEAAAQEATQFASGIVSVINKNINEAPAVVKDDLKKLFPSLDLDLVHGFLDTVLDKVSNVRKEVPLTLEDAIAEGQAYLKQHEGDPGTWGVVSKGLYTLLALCFTPDTSPQEIDAAGEYVHHLIVKPHVEELDVPEPEEEEQDTAAPEETEDEPDAGAAPDVANAGHPKPIGRAEALQNKADEHNATPDL